MKPNECHGRTGQRERQLPQCRCTIEANEGKSMTDERRQEHARHILETHAQQFVRCFACGIARGEVEECDACRHNRQALSIVKRLEVERIAEADVAARRRVGCDLTALVFAVFGAVWWWAGGGYACAWMGLVFVVRLLRDGYQLRRGGHIDRGGVSSPLEDGGPGAGFGGTPPG